MSDLTRDDINKLKLKAFKSSTQENLQTYWHAVSTWFQQSEYAEIETARRIANLEAERDAAFEKGRAAGVAEERERCASFIEDDGYTLFLHGGPTTDAILKSADALAAAIRKGGE